jgi:hypothetical protein
MSRAIERPGRESAAPLMEINYLLAAYGAGLASTYCYHGSSLASGVIFYAAMLCGALAYKRVADRDPVLRSRRNARHPASAYPLWDRDLDG